MHVVRSTVVTAARWPKRNVDWTFPKTKERRWMRFTGAIGSRLWDHRVTHDGRRDMARYEIFFARGIGRYVCVGNYYIITQISWWVRTWPGNAVTQCSDPELRATRPARCLKMVRRTARLVHCLPKTRVTFHRASARSLTRWCAKILHGTTGFFVWARATQFGVPFSSCIPVARHDFQCMCPHPLYYSLNFYAIDN